MTRNGEARGRRWRGRAINGILLLTSIGLTAGLAELTVRLVAPQQLILIRPDIWRPADTVGWLHRARVDTEINTGERTVHLYTDREGFRVGQAGRTEGDARILLIGDSFMEALQVDFEQSLAGLLEAQLPRDLGRTVAVRNAAVGGWGPNQYLMRTRALLDGDEAFDLVLVALFVDNDAVDFRVDRLPPRSPVRRARFRIPRRLAWPELVSAFLTPINDFLEVRSHLFILLKNRMETLRMRLGLMPRYFPVAFLKSEADSPRWALTGEICRDIARTAEQHGVPTLFLLIPAAYQVDRTVFEGHLAGFDIDPAIVDPDQPNRLLAESLRSHGLHVADALPVFRAAHSAGLQLYGTVDRHLSPAGHQTLARFVRPLVLDLLQPGLQGGGGRQSGSP